MTFTTSIGLLLTVGLNRISVQLNRMEVYHIVLINDMQLTPTAGWTTSCVWTALQHVMFCLFELLSNTVELHLSSSKPSRKVFQKSLLGSKIISKKFTRVAKFFEKDN